MFSSPPVQTAPLEPPPSYDEVIRLPAHYPKVETFVPEMVVPSDEPAAAAGTATRSAATAPSCESPPAFSVGGLARIKPISAAVSSATTATST